MKNVPRGREKRQPRQRSGSPEGSRLGSILRGTIEDQIKQNDPPEVAATLRRLGREGFERPEAIDLLAAVLAAEMFEMMTKGRAFDLRRYAENLARLPELPPESDDN